MKVFIQKRDYRIRFFCNFADSFLRNQNAVSPHVIPEDRIKTTTPDKTNTLLILYLDFCGNLVCGAITLVDAKIATFIHPAKCFSR